MASTQLLLTHGPKRKVSMNHGTVIHAVKISLNNYILKVAFNYGHIIHASSQPRCIYYPIICRLFCASLREAGAELQSILELEILLSLYIWFLRGVLIGVLILRNHLKLPVGFFFLKDMLCL